jgi:hypothetical protein
VPTKRPSGLNFIRQAAESKIAPPAVVIAAAEAELPAFRIEAYYPAVLRLREKGHSWRRIAEWLGEFNIEISYVHLRRLFAAESQRRSAAADPLAGGASAGDGSETDDEEKWTRL